MILYSSSTEANSSPPDAGKYIRLGIVAIIGIIILVIVGNQGVILSMNMTEFGYQFTKPLYYSIVSALVLSAVALVNVDIKNRSSIVWYSIHVMITFLNRTTHDPVSRNVTSFRDYRLSVPQFVIWQITKIFLFGAFFVNIMFGLTMVDMADNNDLGIDNLSKLFLLPFLTPQSSDAAQTVISLIPALTILVPPLLGVIGIRLALYVGLHSIVKVITSYMYDSTQGKPKFLNYVSTIEGIIGIGIIWAGINMFFTEQIDYNTRYVIGGTLLAGLILIGFSIFDKMRSKVLTHPIKRDIYIRVLVLIAIAIIVGSVMAVNNSIADTRKIEYLGPYTQQQITVNRYLGELDKIKVNVNDVKLESVSPNNIKSYIEKNKDILSSIRIWDWEAAFAKLKPEIGQRQYVEFDDNDILRFNSTMYWAASMKPVLPSTVSLENRWYNEHLVYTHIPNGFLTLDATTGQSIDSDKLFAQRSIYYGEGGLFSQTWSAYPTNRQTSAELDGALYSGKGGIDVSPPLSWIFEPNFLLSYPTDSVHVMRYKDVNDRMQTLYPYFLYNMFGQNVDFYPVTDGNKTYWLIPLIIGFDTNSVPWSMGNPYLRLVGFALVDTYDGNITLLKYGNDYFAKMIQRQYGDKFVEIPSWLSEQVRYPQELFTWKTEMYNIYHVTNTEEFIQANQFFKIPDRLEAYYIEAKPPGFEQTKFLGLLSLELRVSQGRNLSGYMIVENDLPTLGNMQFYQVPTNSTTKLIGPTAVREALEKDTDFSQLKTLLRNPRIGDNILYRVGDHDVYFIPVYTAGSGEGVVAQLGTIAAVGAAFDGEYYVGLGNTQEAAFEAYLHELSGVVPTSTSKDVISPDKNARIQQIRSLIEEKNLQIVTPTTIQIPLSFKEGEISYYTQSDLDATSELTSKFVNDFVIPRSKKILMWQDGDALNIGTIITVDNVTELHYISIGVGK